MKATLLPQSLSTNKFTLPAKKIQHVVNKLQTADKVNVMKCSRTPRYFSEKIPNCAENSADPSTCYMKFTPNGPFTDLETKCSAARGTLPRPTSIELANSLWTVAGGNVWIGLTTNTPTAK